MNCPVCKEPMIVVEEELVEVDLCLGCGGSWLDGGELELLFGDAEACAAVLALGSADTAHGEKPRKCPLCRKKMGKRTVGGDPAVTFDVCSRGEGMWFDKGELQAVLEQGGGAFDERITGFLRDIFSGGEGPGSNKVAR